MGFAPPACHSAQARCTEPASRANAIQVWPSAAHPDSDISAQAQSFPAPPPTHTHARARAQTPSLPPQHTPFPPNKAPHLAGDLEALADDVVVERLCVPLQLSACDPRAVKKLVGVAACPRRPLDTPLIFRAVVFLLVAVLIVRLLLCLAQPAAKRARTRICKLLAQTRQGL
eukprot:351456-Chlamydomonas_euryale.AAC.3